MASILTSVHLPDANGMPADDTINTFITGSTGGSGVGVMDAIDGALPHFYNTAPAGGMNELAHYMALSLDRTANACTMVHYLLAAGAAVDPGIGNHLGAPARITHWTLGAGGAGSADIPRECAAVLSLYADLSGLAEDVPGGAPGPVGDTHPRARHRGRLYLGPFQANAVGSGANGPGINAALRDTATTAARVFALAISAALEGLAWRVWSRKNGLAPVIVGGWMDDAWDTQRRRGIGASTRTAWTVA